MSTPPRRPALRLVAEDADDLAVISAALQDGVLKLGDIAYDPKARSLTLAVNRFVWEGEGRDNQRIRSGLQIASVLGVQSRRLKRDAPGAVVSLLSLAFEPGEAPGGILTLSFSGDADLRLTVECIDAVLADISASWPTPRRPDHPED